MALAKIILEKNSILFYLIWLKPYASCFIFY